MAFTPEANLLPMSLTPAINHCPGFPVIAGVVDTGNKFITGVEVTSEQLSPVTTTPTINLSPGQRHR
jgi:hypothetical protein